MEIIIKINGQAVAVEVSVEVANQISEITLNVNSNEVESLNEQLQHMSYEQIRQFLMTNYNPTPEEATALAQYQTNQSANSYSFPSHPKIGTKHNESIVVHVSISGEIAALAGIILSKSKYVKLAYTLSVASAIVALGSDALGRNVRVTTQYTYGYTNDGVLGWAPGYSTYKIIKLI